jgi:hypothetical protein
VAGRGHDGWEEVVPFPMKICRRWGRRQILSPLNGTKFTKFPSKHFLYPDQIVIDVIDVSHGPHDSHDSRDPHRVPGSGNAQVPVTA